MTAPRVFVVAGWRYEPGWLVDELRANCAWADRVVIVDDRDRAGELWVHEGEYRKMQRAALEQAGIEPWDWVLVTSPDERWSRDAGPRIRAAIRDRRRRIVWQFPLREMWTPRHWRADGQWGRKTRGRLFPYLPDQTFTDRRIQTQPFPTDDGYERLAMSRPVVYHLENVEPESRVERVLVYEALSPGSIDVDPAKWAKADPDSQYIRKYGYAYLADPRRCQLVRVPRGEFVPPVTRIYRFRVPDELLYAETGVGRTELIGRIAATLGLPVSRLFERVRG